MYVYQKEIKLISNIGCHAHRPANQLFMYISTRFVSDASRRHV